MTLREMGMREDRASDTINRVWVYDTVRVSWVRYSPFNYVWSPDVGFLGKGCGTFLSLKIVAHATRVLILTGYHRINRWRSNL